MPAIAITTIIQVLLIIHVIRSGRDRTWVWVLLLLPLIGGIAYLVLELIPEWRGTVSGQRTQRLVKETLDPGADIRSCERAWEQSPNAENARLYAAALIHHQHYPKALEILDQATTGLFRYEPNLLLLQAQAQFEMKDFQAAKDCLESLIEENPEFKSAEGHLLYARSLEALEQWPEALENYVAVSNYFPGAEARFRYCQALQRSGQAQAASEEVTLLLKDAELAPAHFRKSQKSWLHQAKHLQHELSEAE
ncbi:MAG: tetratricopeptide repeat protein [Xanthomonadales bacterium]|nr:tetratricopeptide repeat protein [Xanthomonadales bacterium]